MSLKNNAKRFINEQIKNFNSFNKLNKIIYLVVILVFIAYILYFTYFLGIYISLSFNLTDNILLSPLGFNFEGPSQVFISWAFFLLIPFFINFFLTKKVNFYLWGSIYLSLFLIIFGLGFIGEAYKTDLPSNTIWINYANQDKSFNIETCDFTSLDCKSVKDKVNFVEDDEVSCWFQLEKDCHFWISSFEVIKDNLNSKNKTLLESNIDSTNYTASFSFKVEKSIKSIIIYPLLSNGSYSLAPFYGEIELNNIYSTAEYNSMIQSKSLSLITLISISIFSTLIAMNNLKQIIERKKF